MTNEEKADKICKRHIFDSNHYDCCMEMAKWKDEENKEILLAYTKWLDKRGFFKEELQCDFPHQIETFLEMKGGENGND